MLVLYAFGHLSWLLFPSSITKLLIICSVLVNFSILVVDPGNFVLPYILMISVFRLPRLFQICRKMIFIYIFFLPGWKLTDQILLGWCNKITKKNNQLANSIPNMFFCMRIIYSWIWSCCWMELVRLKKLPTTIGITFFCVLQTFADYMLY